MSIILHPESLSPDPSYGRELNVEPDGWARFELHPAALATGDPNTPWASRDRFQPWAGCLLQRDRLGHQEILVDFGAELEAEIELVLETPVL